MKRKISLFMVFAILLVNLFSVSAFASDITPRNNNTASTTTDFVINSDGLAYIACNYDGYPGITTGADIEIAIQKRSFLFFSAKETTSTFLARREEAFPSIIARPTSEAA